MGAPKRFDELPGIAAPTLAVLAQAGFTTATPVQEATIPLFCGHKDVAVDACTGSGKTLAFVIPVVEKLRRLEERLRPNQVGAVIVSPTRELAKQIFHVAEPFVDTVPGARAMLLVGGSDPAADVARLASHGATVLIGTPGRLADVVARTRGNAAALDLRRLEVLVLDEADRLLDMGFQPQLDALMAAFPRQRRTGLFSATQTEAVQALARAGLRNPVRINVAVAGTPARGTGAEAAGGQKTPSRLSIQYLVCDVEQKLPYLVHFLQEHRQSKVIVYFLTCACVDFFATALDRLPAARGLAVTSLHGRMKQAAREAALAAFAEAPAGVLFCTDVAARGLDIPDVHWIVQHDAPQDPAAFVHRVGRTARMGRAGSALALLAPHETAYVELLRLRRVPLTEADADASAALSSLPDLCADVRALAEADRDVMEKGTRAFVSWVRGYKEHQCRFIFRLADVDLGRLGHVFGLLRMPRMAEIKHAAEALKNFRPSSVDPETVQFRENTREKQRQKALRQAAAAAPAQSAQPAGPKPGKGAGKRPQLEEARLPAAKRRLLDGRQDAAELADEYALLRKLKKGKLSEHDFDLATGIADDELDAADSKGQTQRQKGTQKHSAQSIVASTAAQLKRSKKRARKKQQRTSLA